MKYYRFNNKGMATVEAVIIIPITFTIIMLLVWTGVLFYNRNALDQAAYEAAVIGGQNSEKSNEEICEIVKNRFAENIKGKTVLIDQAEISVSVSYEKIQVMVNGSMSFPEIAIFEDVYNNRIWNITINQEAARLRPSVFVRTVSRIKNGLDNHAYSEESSDGKETL